MSHKPDVLFKSKDYGISGHNTLELRNLENGEVRLWITDGGKNALICMDRGDLISLAKQLARVAKTAPVEVELFDFTKPIRKKKITTTSESNGVKKKRKTRSDKGVRRA